MIEKKSSKRVDLRFQKELPLWMAETNVPAVGVAIIENGKLTVARVFGEVQKGVVAPKDTLFDVCSLTKPIAAMIVLKLASKGKWDIDEPLCHYWIDSDVKNDARLEKLTTRFVLSHQSGFTNWRWNNPSKKLSFEFEPGTRYQYSGEGFVYMKRAIEKKFGQSWKLIANSILFAPLGMRNTNFTWNKKLKRSAFADPHDKNGKRLTPEFEQKLDLMPHLATTIEEIEYYYSPAGSLITTIGEYGKFAKDVLKGAGLSKDVSKEMITPQKKIFGSVYTGLGWMIATDLSDNQYALVHTGDDPGLRTFVILFPQTNRGVVVLTNGDNGDEIYKRIIKESIDVGGEVILKFGQ